MNVNIVGFGPLDERLCFEFSVYLGLFCSTVPSLAALETFLQMQFLWVHVGVAPTGLLLLNLLGIARFVCL